MSTDQSVALRLRVATPAQAAKLPRAPDSGLYPGHIDPFYNIQCDILSAAAEAAFCEKVQRTGGDWSRGFADLAAEKLGDTPFAVLALRDGVVVGWLRFYRAGTCNLRAPVKSRPAVGKALVVGAACVTTNELLLGTVPKMIDEAVNQAKRLGLAEVHAIASPDIRAYSNWCNQFMLRDYQSRGFEVVERTPAVTDDALRDMANGDHGEAVRASVQGDGIRDTYLTSYCLVRKTSK